MDIAYLEIIEGPLNGEIYPIEAGMTFGRKKADINLMDKKVSNIHASIEKKGENWLLIDHTSTNGTHVDNQRIVDIELKDGLSIKMGSTVLLVHMRVDEQINNESSLIKEISEEVSTPQSSPSINEDHTSGDLPQVPNYNSNNELILKKATNSTSIKSSPEEQNTKLNSPDKNPLDLVGDLEDEDEDQDQDQDQDSVIKEPENLLENVYDNAIESQPEKKEASEIFVNPKVEIDPSHWKDVLTDILTQKTFKSLKEKKVIAFKNIIVLNIFRGLQTGETWTLGYGPRTIGANSIDLTIFEDGAPADCFTITPHNEGAQFITDHPDAVLINNTSQKEYILSPGDVITVGHTEIEVQIIL